MTTFHIWKKGCKEHTVAADTKEDAERIFICNSMAAYAKQRGADMSGAEFEEMREEVRATIAQCEYRMFRS